MTDFAKSTYNNINAYHDTMWTATEPYLNELQMYIVPVIVLLAIATLYGTTIQPRKIPFIHWPSVRFALFLIIVYIAKRNIVLGLALLLAVLTVLQNTPEHFSQGIENMHMGINAGCICSCGANNCTCNCYDKEFTSEEIMEEINNDVVKQNENGVSIQQSYDIPLTRCTKKEKKTSFDSQASLSSSSYANVNFSH